MAPTARHHLTTHTPVMLGTSRESSRLTKQTQYLGLYGVRGMPGAVRFRSPRAEHPPQPGDTVAGRGSLGCPCRTVLPASRGRGRVFLESGPTPALWRSAFRGGRDSFAAPSPPSWPQRVLRRGAAVDLGDTMAGSGADRWVSMPNGAYGSRGRGRSVIEPGPTPALWRSAPFLILTATCRY
jgi:hypothetical protein